MTIESASMDVVNCRDFRSAVFVARMLDLQNKSRALEEKVEELRIQRELRKLQVPFMGHESITQWVAGFSAPNYGVVGRCSVLALIGESNSAKTWKAISL